MSNASDDPVPRDVLALVILHGLLAGPNDVPLATVAPDVLADLVYKLADAMKSRGEQ
jgi:hypothetical protein